MKRPREVTDFHTRILKCSLETDDARVYWARVEPGDAPTAQRAFEQYWFGARSLSRVEELLRVFRARFDVFPGALETLHRWPHMAGETRTAICHWHVQLTDPLYRRFTGEFLVALRQSFRPEIDRDTVARFVEEQAPGRWGMATRLQFGSKLLTAANAAGLVTGRRDPRPLTLPRIPTEALEYLLYLLRGVDFTGTLLDNPYVASVGLEGPALAARLRSLEGVRFESQGELVSFQWQHEGLGDWAKAHFPEASTMAESHR